MSPRGSQQKKTVHRVGDAHRISPDDVKYRMLERDRLATLDTRTESERWLGDPPPNRSALAQRLMPPPETASQARDKR
jgi:hypothetical protein